jgi:Transposase DDE domain
MSGTGIRRAGRPRTASPSSRSSGPSSPATTRPMTASAPPWCTDRPVGRLGIGLARGRPLEHSGAPAVPFKANQDRRHRIPSQRHRVTNWAAYDAALRRRGSLTVWFSEKAVAAWKAAPHTTRGGQPSYSALAIATALTLRAVFPLALRQTEGLIGSLPSCSASTSWCPTTPPSAAAPRHWRCRGHSRGANLCTCWWTARGSSSAASASGWWRGTAPGRVAGGESSTSPDPEERGRCETRFANCSWSS